MKNQFCSIIMIMTIALIFVSPISGIAADEDIFTAADGETLKTSTDPDAVADVIYKLSDIFAEKGKAALKPAIPALLASAERELALPEEERWNIYDIIKVISMAGDESVMPFLLNVMSSMGGGGNPYTAQGFYSIGKSSIKAVTDSLISPVADTKGRAALTLHKMFGIDESGTFFSAAEKNKIKDILVTNLGNANPSVRIYSIVALRSFGDDSVLNPIENIEKTDAHKDSGGYYEVRLEATETLKILKGN
ncbi:hypothetical protein ACFL6K_06790 [Candidatus Latescibacterota bacterium]